MRFRTRYITAALLIMLLAGVGVAAGQGSSWKRVPIGELYAEFGGNDDSLRRFVYSVMQEGDFNATVEYSRELYDFGKKYGNEHNVVFAAALAGSGYIHIREQDSAYHYLNEAIELGEKIGFDWGLATAYNGMGLYAANFGDSDHYEAIQYFSVGLEAARRSGNEKSYSVLLSNIASMYNLRNDPAGLPYALEAYERGEAAQDDYLKFAGGHAAASCYFVTADYDNALKYVKLAEKAITPKSTGEKMSAYKAILVYTLYGNILLDMGDSAGAARRYDKALEYKDEALGDQLVMTYFGYGDYYKRKGIYTKALDMFRQGVELSEREKNQVYLNMFYREISNTYEAMGDYRNANIYLKKYYEISENLFNIENQRSLNRLKVLYELEKKETEIIQNKLQLLQERRKTQIFALILAIVLLAMAALWYMYKRKNRYYLEIVKQNQEAVKARTRLQIERRRRSEPEPDNAKYSNSPLSNEKGIELFNALENLMESDKIYRDSELNIDKLAEMLGSNRSYLSRTINEYSGLNFNNYINKYRIDEAVEILSDTENDIPLKALAADLGFNTLVTFYNSFQREISIPPSQYRKKVIELKNAAK